MPQSHAQRYTDEERRLLAPYVTNLDEPIYCFTALPPEVTAVLFAYVSRSPVSFRDNLLKLLNEGDLSLFHSAEDLTSAAYAEEDRFGAAVEKAKAFHEKWVVGYGHASVAEHADIKYAVEDVSILASKVLEDNRLGAYTEKSTRYQVYDRTKFYTDASVTGSGVAGVYGAAIDRLFNAYSGWYDELLPALAEAFPKPEGAKERPWKNSLHAKACDVVRYLLPAATLTSIGVSMNARTAAHAISKLMSHELPEMRAIGGRMRDEGERVCPALLKYAGEKPYLRETPKALRELAERLAIDARAGEAGVPFLSSGDDGYARVTLLHADVDAEERVLAAALYPIVMREGASDYRAAMAATRSLSDGERDAVFDEMFSVGRLGDFDWPQRALEATSITFELVCDYGAYRDIQRHRMCTQIARETGFADGYDVPMGLELIGKSERFHELMGLAAEAGAEVAAELPEQAAYLVPLAYRKRVLFSMNLREAWHFVRLRSAEGGHVSYRRVAQATYEMVRATFPRLGRYFRCDYGKYDLDRLASETRQEHRREKLGASHGAMSPTHGEQG